MKLGSRGSKPVNISTVAPMDNGSLTAVTCGKNMGMDFKKQNVKRINNRKNGKNLLHNLGRNHFSITKLRKSALHLDKVFLIEYSAT